jgi:hypothetical protein
MKTMFPRFLFLILALTLTAQLAFAVPTLKIGQNANSSTTASTAPKPDKRCKKKCANSYRMCLRRAGKNKAERRSCEPRYELCLGYCG